MNSLSSFIKDYKETGDIIVNRGCTEIVESIGSNI